MTRLKFDVTGVDPGGDFKVPKPGAYSCKIDVIEPKESQAGNDMLEVQYVIIDDGEFEGSRLWDYIVLNESSAWKYRRFLEAVGAVSGRKEKGEIDLDKMIGKRVLVKVTNEDSDEWGKRARVGSVSRLSKADLDEDEPEDEDEEAEEDDEDEEGEELTADDVRAMKKVELKELINDEELGLRVTKQTKLNTLRERVIEALGLNEEEEEDEEDEDEPDDEEEEAAEEEEEDEEEDEEDDEVEEVEDYAELSVTDLRAECKERGLNPKGSKALLVKRLNKDDDETDAL